MRNLLCILTMVLPSGALIACNAGGANNFAASDAASNATPAHEAEAIGNGATAPAAAGPSVPDRPNAGRIAIRRGTLASVYIHADPPMAARLRLPQGASMSLGSALTETLAQRLRAAGMPAGMFNVNSPVPAGDRNISIRLFVRPGSGPQSYRITLTAAQGRAYWSATRDRPTGRHPDHRQMRGEEGEPTGNPQYESLIMDTRELAQRLSETIEIGEDAR